MTSVIGLDLSLTSTGIATPDGEIALRSGPTTGMERLAFIRAEISTIARSYVDPVVYIEGYSFSSRASHAHAAGELGGVIRLMLWTDAIPYVDIPPATVKKFATGKGNANKDLVVSHVTNRAGRIFDSNDIVDAYVLRSIGCVLQGQPCPLGDMPKTHLAALDKLKETP